MNSGAELPLTAAEATLPSNTLPLSEIGEASESSMRVATDLRLWPVYHTNSLFD